jgi:hypothetical protein
MKMHIKGETQLSNIANISAGIQRLANSFVSGLYIYRFIDHQTISNGFFYVRFQLMKRVV